MTYLASAFAGALFGFGLALAHMTDPAKIVDFLDFGGTWDPTLAFVMGGALLVTLISFRPILRQPRPLLDRRFVLPTRRDIDGRLLGGAALFGIGWGLAGLCPGPGLVAVLMGVWQPAIFVLGLVIGTLAFRRLPGESIRKTVSGRAMRR